MDKIDDKYDETHRIIANMAGVKMRMNSHKGNIESEETNKILQMLFDEVRELEEALKEGNMMHIIEESADCLNFLVAITHQQVERYRGRKEISQFMAVDIVAKDVNVCTYPKCNCPFDMGADNKCARGYPNLGREKDENS